jgi:hypothetical protein
MIKRLPTANAKKARDKLVMFVTRCMNSEIPCRSGPLGRSTELVRRHRTGTHHSTVGSLGEPTVEMV